MARKGSKAEGRDKAGRFAKGNQLGLGNPHLRRVASMRKALDKVCTEDRMERAIERLCVMAEAGDIDAIKELLDRGLGRPHKEPRAVHGFMLEHQPKCTADLVAAYGQLVQATTRGEVSTDDAKVLGDLLGGALKVAELAELEQRIKALEALSKGPGGDDAP